MLVRNDIQEHFDHFGVSGNFRCLLLVVEQAKRSWCKWLCRRSQRKRLTWERFADLLRDFPLPKPRILVPIWRGPGVGDCPGLLDTRALPPIACDVSTPGGFSPSLCADAAQWRHNLK